MRDSFSNTKDTMNENLEAADDYNPEKDLSNAKTDPDNNNNIQRYGIRSACSQIMVAVAQNFLLVALGMSFGMPTVILGALSHKVASNQTRLESPELILNDEQSSWMGSILFLFHPFGAVISGYLVEIIGRKKIFFNGSRPCNPVEDIEIIWHLYPEES
ncbi:hypothetical protein M8J77_020378 [Diaphorina citri]|nr:hypothetical protein M8J77_020378 [Diaphorina citri]